MTVISLNITSFINVTFGRNLIVIPDKNQLNVIKHVHDKGHFYRKGWEEILNEEIVIINMSSKIDNVIGVTWSFVQSQTSTAGRRIRYLPKEQTPLQSYHINHLKPLEASNKN